MTTVTFTELNKLEINQEECFDPHSNLHISLFGKPIEIGHFSIDVDKKIRFDKRKMKYLISDFKIGELDLNAGYSANQPFQQYVTKEKLNRLLQWIIHSKSKPHVDFVTVRGTLTRIMCTPYSDKNHRSKWEICASKFNGMIYLTAIDMDSELNRIVEFPKLLQFMSWGYKFEQYLTTEKIGGSIDLTPKNNYEEYCIVLKNRLNDLSLLYQAEVDAVIPHHFPPPGCGDTSCYAELKTSQIITRPSEKYRFCSGKLNTWWAQSYLTGISHIICGRRDEKGMVKYLDFHRLSDICEMSYGLWSSEVCLNFLDKFLNFVKRIVAEDNPNVVYKFLYNGEGVINIEKLANPEDKYRVIPNWYRTAMDSLG